ncbi:mariner Mos1 transposase [Trichonephila clavipes]|nr:mariner Mos1 transposase [Trichonephila clavipes]
MHRIIAIYDAYIRSFESEVKRQSNECRYRGSPRAHKFPQEPYQVQVTSIVAYDWEGVICMHAVLTGQDVNAHYYCRFLQHHLRPVIRLKRLRLLQDNLPVVCCITRLVVKA